MEIERLVACQPEKVALFYSELGKLIAVRKYMKGLISNVDETGLLTKFADRTKVIATRELKNVNVLKENKVTSCTAVPVISAGGEFEVCAFVFPEDFDLGPLRDHHPRRYVYYKTKNGFMTKIVLAKFMREEVKPRILENIQRYSHPTNYMSFDVPLDLQKDSSSGACSTSSGLKIVSCAVCSRIVPKTGFVIIKM
jgi:hypothetical protein